MSPSDSERLDWMGEHYASFNNANSRGPGTLHTTIRWTSLTIAHWPHQRITTAAGDFRAAIDLAMMQQAHENEYPDDDKWLERIAYHRVSGGVGS